MELYEELLKIIDCLNDNKIDYALCGGMAVAFYGYPRFTKDIDFLLMSDDLPHMKRVLGSIGYTITAGPFPFDINTQKQRIIYRISKIEKNDVFTIDMLLVNPMLKDVWASREIFDIEGHRIQVVSREGLITMKNIAARDQDKLDIKKLEEAENGE